MKIILKEIALNFDGKHSITIKGELPSESNPYENFKDLNPNDVLEILPIKRDTQ